VHLLTVLRDGHGAAMIGSGWMEKKVYLLFMFLQAMVWWWNE
jgi:hypothetical protein